MALTIQQIQDRITAGYDQRDIINLLADYIQANPVGGASYLVYLATIPQASSNPPNATILENTLGGEVIWNYSTNGVYYCTLNGAFVIGKTSVMITPDSNTLATVITSFDWDMPNSIGILSFQEIGGELSKQDGIMGDLTTIEIRVYP